MDRYLVTGGAGFIGSNLVDALLKGNKNVRVFDNLSTGDISNLRHCRKDIDFMKGDLRDPRAVRRAVKGVRYVFHIAAVRSVVRSVDNPLESNDANVNGTLNVLLAARDLGVKRVVYSGSSSAYGESRKFPLQEIDPPNPVSPYAASKLMGEHYCRIFTRLYGLETVALRYFNVFGPRQNPASKYSAVIPLFIYHLLRDRSPEIHWDGRQSRDFSYIDNIVEGNLCAIRAAKASGELFNIACHEEHAVIDIFNEVRRILNKPGVRPKFLPKRAGDIRRTLADISKAKKILGYRVQTRFKEGLKKTVEWFLASGVLNKVRL
jgi:nucleoside-diphosphate-sugar epimerase